MRTLGWIAIGGLGIGIASLSLAYALGGRDLHRLPFDLASSASCGEVAKGSPSVRRLAWDNGDAIELSLPGTVYLPRRPGQRDRRARIARPRRQCRGERRSPDARLPRLDGRARSGDHVAGPRLP